jgi:hypothetical protein
MAVLDSKMPFAAPALPLPKTKVFGRPERTNGVNKVTDAFINKNITIYGSHIKQVKGVYFEPYRIGLYSCFDRRVWTIPLVSQP